MTFKGIPLIKGLGVGILVVLLSVQPALGLIFLQDVVDITDTYESEQTTVITLLNDQPRAQNVLLQIDVFSQYLEPHVSLDKTSITLNPAEKKNILVNTDFPSSLSPETHSLDITAVTDDAKESATTSITFTVPGVAKPSLEILKQDFSLEREEKVISVELENTGNVILQPKPQIIVSANDSIVKTIDYKTPLQIMPGESYPITLRADTSSFTQGSYDIFVKFVARDGIQLATEQVQFEVYAPGSQPLAKKNYLKPILIGISFIVLLAGLWYVNKEIKRREDPLDKKIRKLHQREKELDRELHRLIKKTNHLIRTGNTWIHKNMGEEYELR